MRASPSCLVPDKPTDWHTSASFQPLTGKMYARFNSKVLFLGFFTIFNIGSAICGAAQTSVMLILGRFIAGVGGAGLMNGGFTMIHASIPPERRPGMLGIFMACKWQR
jgi:MFS family permease